MTQTHDAAGSSPADRFPRVPAHAWSWLQRSRPVLAEASRRLDGGPPGPGFVDTLRERFAHDAFTRDVLVSVIADVAFNGRIPRRRPTGASWDRGLTWWAATIAGITPQAFEASAPAGEQSRLFGVEDPAATAGGAGARQAPGSGRRPGAQPATPRGPDGDRAMLTAALHDLLRQAEDDRVPAAAIRSLLAQLERPHSAGGASGR